MQKCTKGEILTRRIELLQSFDTVGWVTVRASSLRYGILEFNVPLDTV